MYTKRGMVSGYFLHSTRNDAVEDADSNNAPLNRNVAMCCLRCINSNLGISYRTAFFTLR